MIALVYLLSISLSNKFSVMDIVSHKQDFENGK